MEIVLTIFFYIAAGLCFFSGVYSLYTNMFHKLNKLAYLFCMSLGIWIYGAMRSRTALTIEDAVLWGRFAAIGIAAFFGFLLHYAIALVKRNQRQPWWLLILIYVPSAIILYLLALNTQTTSKFYYMLQTPLGWINIRHLSMSTIIFELYIMVYLSLGMFFLIKWKKSIYVEMKARSIDSIFKAYFFVLFIVLISEMACYFTIGCYFYYMVPIMIMIPIIYICFAMIKYQFMKTEIYGTENLYMEEFRTKIMQLIAISLFAGSILYIATNKYLHENWLIRDNLLFVLLFWFFGGAIYLIQLKSKHIQFKNLMYALILSLTIPVIMLRYTTSAAVTVWAFPMLIFIAALLFRNTVILITVSYSAMLMQLYFWIFYPDKVVSVDVTNYLGRSIIMAMAILLIYYINNIYLLRLKQLSDKIKTQDLLFSLSSDVLNLESQNFEKRITDILEQLGKYLSADHIIMQYEPQNEVRRRHFWSKDTNAVVSDEEINKLYHRVCGNEEVSEKGYLVIPIMRKGYKVGFLCASSAKDSIDWNDDDIKIFSTAGNILGEAENRVRHEIKVEHMECYDQLTAIPNKQLFGEIVNNTIAGAEDRKVNFCILFLDLDSFKNINDTKGHQFGDQILIAIAERLGACLRKTDAICRFGGDEFLILLTDVIADRDIERAVSKILDQFAIPFSIQDEDFKITASIGVSRFPVDGNDKDTLIKNADIAMYKAKIRGKNQAVLCTGEMKEETSQTFFITNELERAMENQELSLVYQPQILVETGQIIAAEALLRWNSRVLGNISPAIFIPIAEQSDCINKIGEWVLREACRQARNLSELNEEPIRMAVNVSVKQLLSAGFVELVSSILKETQVDPSYLELEITENIAIQDSKVLTETLLNLKRLNISIAIDDFGMEYSSLGRIKTLPVDRLKLDMAFVKGILTSEKDRVILDAIINMTKNLGMKVIAEGVEEEMQYRFLKEKNCDEIQGYYFYKPLSLDLLRETLLQRGK